MKYQYERVQTSENETGINTNLRTGFVRKVYGILSVQLSATALVCYLSSVSTGMQNLVFSLQIPALIGVVVSMLWLTMSKTASKEVPKNFILLGAFTIFESLALANLLRYFSADIIQQAFFFTASVTIGLTLYAMTTKKDLTVRGSTVSILLSAFSTLVFVNIFFNVQFLFTLYLVAGTIVYAYYLVYHTQAIIGGKQGQVDLDDYVKAALTLYLDIIQLFIKILRILQQLQESGKKKDKK